MCVCVCVTAGSSPLVLRLPRAQEVLKKMVAKCLKYIQRNKRKFDQIAQILVGDFRGVQADVEVTSSPSSPSRPL